MGKKYIILLFLCLQKVFLPAQNQGNVIELSSPVNGGEIKACEAVILKPGFSFTASSGNSLTLKTDPSACIPSVQTETVNFSAGQNYIVTVTPLDPTADVEISGTQISMDSGTRANITVRYFDGLGRPSQIAEAKKGGASQDLVTLIEYDSCGRQERVWLPAARPGNNGAYVTPSTLRAGSKSSNLNDAEPYSLIKYEESPLNRPLKEFGPGADWHTRGKAVHTGYLTNLSARPCGKYTSTNNRETVSISRSGTYADGLLFVTETRDEDERVSYEFKDKSGQTLLVRQMDGSEKHDTYYIYDDYGNLRAVLPPMASDLLAGNGTRTESNVTLQQYAYLYKYDTRNRCIAKKLPGAGWIKYYYDKADRLIFSQDGEQSVRGEWTFTIPDAFGRVVLTGTTTTAPNRTTLDNTAVVATWADTANTNKGYTLNYPLTNAAFLTVNYYDQYDFRGKNNVPSSTSAAFGSEPKGGYPSASTGSAKGLLTGTITAMPEGSEPFLYSVYYYDDRGRRVHSKFRNHLGKIEKEYVSYNFDGSVKKRFRQHNAFTVTDSEEYIYAYDHAGRPVKTTHKWNNNSPGRVLSENIYDELGRLKRNKPIGMASLESENHYDVRSRLLRMYRWDFNDVLTYTPGGNVSTYHVYLAWDHKKYAYDYDGLSRVTKARYTGGNGDYNVSYSYDKNGNMLTLNRKGKRASGNNYGHVDSLTYTYEGNRMKKMHDAVSSVPYAFSQDFKDYENLATEYTYNLNGSMSQDLNSGISNIKYNILNLPEQIDILSPVAEARNTYHYSADGVKRRVVRESNSHYSINPIIGSDVNTSSLASPVTTDYAGNLVFVNDTLKRVLTENGFMEGTTYYCTIKDYLGSTRIVTDSTSTGTSQFRQWMNYYPFGMAYGDSWNVNIQPYKYTGQEFDHTHGLNLYDYNARFYDPAIGRFTTMDPLAEKYYSISPYAYCGNNPVNNIDPNGEDYWSTNDPEQIRQFMQSVRSERLSHDFTGWNHSTDAEFTANLTYNDQTRTYYSSYGSVENGEVTVVGVSFEANINPVTKIGGGLPVHKPISGLRGNLGYYLFGVGSSYTDINGSVWNVNRSGEIVGLAPMGGIAPIPSTNGGNIIRGINQLNKLVKLGKVPKTILRFDKGKILGELDHVHFNNGAALNIDGTWKHGIKALTNKEIKFLQQNGWNIP